MAVRSCVSCGEKKPKQDLKRFVWRDGAPLFDAHFVLEGRGAYCCKEESCVKMFAKQHKRYRRIFRLA